MHERNSPAQPQPAAYLAAFEELDLSWQWDPAIHGAGREGLRAYLEREHPHLLRVYDADFLLQAVEATHERLHRGR
jgi:hypothetical protein